MRRQIIIASYVQWKLFDISLEIRQIAAATKWKSPKVFSLLHVVVLFSFMPMQWWAKIQLFQVLHNVKGQIII